MPAPVAPNGGSPLVEVDCPLCGSERSRALFTVGDYAFRATDATFGVRRCQECSCGYLSPRPAEDDIVRYYPKAYYWSYEGADSELTWDEIIRRRQAQLAGKLKWLEDMNPGRLLDIGAQKGEFLWMMRWNGWQVEGAELDESVPNPARMPIRYGDFLALDFNPSSFDCITMWAVLEHVYAPRKFVDRIVELLRPGGSFIALVTNFDSIQARAFRMDDYPRHLTFFTASAVRRCCQRIGLDLKRVKTDQTVFGGALNGGLVYGFKRLFGYTAEEAFSEWKQIREPELFCCRWRGRPSGLVRNISRVDRLFTLPVERLLDRLGFGFILTFSAEKSSD